VRLCLIINCLGKRDSECEQEFEKLQEYFSKFKGIVNTETKEQMLSYSFDYLNA
jgi:hypothetical protein